MITELQEYLNSINKNIKNKLLLEINVEYPENNDLIDSLYLPKLRNNIFDKLTSCLKYLHGHEYKNLLEESELFNIVNNQLNEVNLKKIYDCLQTFINNLQGLQIKDNDTNKNAQFFIYELYEIENKYKRMESMLLSKVIVVNGDGATGKTHLLTKLSTDLFNMNIPNLIFYGQNICDFDKYVMDVSSTLKKKNIFDFLDNYSKKNNIPFVLIFDAINECRQDKLEVIKKILELKKYDNIRIIISYRNGDIDEMVFNELLIFPNITLYGFSDIIEASVKFSDYYKIDINNILELDFSHNPLTLKVFCEAFSQKGYEKGERGYVSATFVFERYFIHMGDIISKELNLKNQLNQTVKGKTLWDTLGKDIAKEMVANSRQYLKFAEIVKVISNLKLNVTANAILNKLIIHHLIEFSDTNINNNFEKVYKFSFQRLSDFLIIRYVLNSKDENDSYGEFLCSDKIIRLLQNNMSLLETLSEHIPIRIENKEIYDIYQKDLFYDFCNIYIRSLRYRSSRSFGDNIINRQKSILNYIKKNSDNIMYRDWLITIISCSIVDYHPFNSMNYFTPLMLKFNNSKRDIYLIEFLNSEFIRTRIISLCKIPNYSNLAKLKRSLKLNLSHLYFWMLSVSDREVRDKSTKSLTRLFQSDLTLIDELLPTFLKVSDQYIMERFLCVIFSSHVLVNNKQLLKRHYVTLKKTFNKKAISNIKIRYYIMQLQNLCCDRNLYKNKLNLKNVLKMPKLNILEIPNYNYNKFFPQLQKYSNVKFSLNDMGDFGRYIVTPIIKEFEFFDSSLKKRLGKDLEQFKNSLNPLQLKKFNDLYYPKINDNEELLKKYLGKKQKNILDFIKNRELAYNKKMISQEISASTIIHKMIKNGYNKKLEIEDMNMSKMNYGRHEHKIERIGKKYQWIGFFELVGECICNLSLRESSYKDIQDMIRLDIDPLTINDNEKYSYDFFEAYENKLKLYNLKEETREFIDNSFSENMIADFFKLEFDGNIYIPLIIEQDIKNLQNNNSCFLRVSAVYKTVNGEEEINEQTIINMSCGNQKYEYKFNLYEMLLGKDEKEYYDGFETCWKEYFLESEYDNSFLNLSHENKHYYLLKNEISKFLKLRYKNNGIYMNDLDEVICIQSPFYQTNSFYLYLREDYYINLTKDYLLYFGIYCEKSIDKSFNEEKEYFTCDAIYTYDLAKGLVKRAIYRRESGKLGIYGKKYI